MALCVLPQFESPTGRFIQLGEADRMDSAGGSATALAVTNAGGTTQQAGPFLGPGLYEGMGESAMMARLNSWGADRDAEIVRLRSDLLAAQAGVTGAFGQAERALVGIATDWRLEAEAMRTSAHEQARSALSRLELVVGDARARFVAQDATRSADLVELSRRLSIIDGWAQAEPQRVAALLRAAVPTPLGGTPPPFFPAASSPPSTPQPPPPPHHQPHPPLHPPPTHPTPLPAPPLPPRCPAPRSRRPASTSSSLPPRPP